MSTTHNRIKFPDEVTDGDRSKAARLMVAVDEAQSALTAFAAPSMGTRFNLDAGDTVDDWGGADRAPLVLVCPWCGEDVQEGDLYDREFAERWSYSSNIDSDEQVVIIRYDGYGDFRSATLVHEQCNLPVSVPDGWGVDSE